MKLRPYQQSMVDNVFDLFNTHRSVLALCFTGGGKTVMFAHVIKRFLESNPGKRAMVLAERSKIVKQAHKTIGKLINRRVGIEMASHHVDMRNDMFAPEIIVGTVQTQARGGDGLGRMGKFVPDDIGLLVVDECHHAVAAQYRKLIDYYTQNPDVRVLGVTATPDRSDERALGQVFDAVACNFDIHFGVEEGWLVRPRQLLTTVQSLDISHVSTVAGDFKQDELSNELSKDKPLYEIAATALRVCGEKKTIVFAVTVKQAERLTDVMNSMKQGCARFVHGGTPDEERDVLYHDYRVGAFNYLVNVGITVEGYDEPGVEMIVDAAMTKSRAKYTQKFGRMLRPAESIAHTLNDCANASERKALIDASEKPIATYVDLVGVTGKHKPVFTGDILGGRYDEAVIARARKQAVAAGERDEAVDMEALLAKAAAELEENKRRQALRRSKIKAQVEYTTEEIDPFNIYDIKTVDRHADNPYTRQLNEKQLSILRRAGVREPENIPFREAVQLIGRIVADYKAGRASYKQLAALKRAGYPTAVPWTREAASAALDKAFGKKEVSNG